jgi:hypothetical protein
MWSLEGDAPSSPRCGSQTKNNGYDGKKGNGYERSVTLQGDTRKKKNIYVAL